VLAAFRDGVASDSADRGEDGTIDEPSHAKGDPR
jgi:hypothetical protein